MAVIEPGTRVRIKSLGEPNDGVIGKWLTEHVYKSIDECTGYVMVRSGTSKERFYGPYAGNSVEVIEP